MTDEIHVGDVGTVLEITILDNDTLLALDISSATEKEINLKAPDGEKTQHTATFTNDGSDGKIEYTTISGDIDEAGLWRIQGKVILPGGVFYSDIDSFVVEDSLI